MLPYRRQTDVISETTEGGLAASAVLYRNNWYSNGTVSVHLPTRVARQVLGDRGWQHVRDKAAPLRMGRPRRGTLLGNRRSGASYADGGMRGLAAAFGADCGLASLGSIPRCVSTLAAGRFDRVAFRVPT